MLNKKFLYKLILSGFCLPLAFQLNAEETEEAIHNLAPFPVIGETYAFGAQKIQVVDGDQLARRLATNLNDVFAESPSVNVGGGFGPAEKIYIRGIEDKLFNISIDGATQAGYLSHHHGQYSIEPELIKRVIVEPGAGAATSGLGALAGTIEFQTKRAADFLLEDQTMGAFTKLAYAGNMDERRGTAAGFGELGEQWEFLVSYTIAESDDYEDGKGNVVEYTGSDRDRIFAALDGELNEHHRVGFSFEENNTEGQFRHRPNFSGYFNHPLAPNDPVYMEISRRTAVADYGYTSGSDSFAANAKLFYTDFTIDRPSQYEMGYESHGLDLDATTILEDHKIVYGIDYRDDAASFTGKGYVEGFAARLDYTTIDDETVDIYGLYVQDAWQVNDSLQTSFGVRFDNYDYTDKDGNTYEDSGFGPNIGLSLAVARDLDINASYSRAFRGVTPIDVITANEGTIANAAEIDPETSDNWEIGFQYAVGNFFVNGTYFLQKIDDIIVNNSGIRDNGGELETEGYDILVGIQQNGWTASVGVSDTEPELNGEVIIDTEYGVGTGYGRTWNANIEYEFEQWNFILGWTCKHVEAFNESDNPLAHKEEYNVHDLYMRWFAGAREQFSLTLSANNLFDEHYVDHATSGYNSSLQRVAGLAAPGRDIRIAGTYTF